MRHHERHFVDRVGWLRAAVLGANDGILSTASLLMGIAATQADSHELLIAGVAGLTAGAMSMAAGEYVSVSSQSDTEAADLERERQELAEDPAHELRELAGIYEQRGLTPSLAKEVAEQLTEHDALGAHARDELGLTVNSAARPVQASLASAGSFALGAAWPLALAINSPLPQLPWILSLGSLVGLALLGVGSARMGGSAVWQAALRVTFGGALAMGTSSLVGYLFGAAVG
ncbi:MAG: VIT1/CCC1 family predicted Fe2+/Mn2+ transporter [Cognaticolwellia sp.]